MKTVCVIQARTQSTRLRGKVLMALGGHPVMAWVVRACATAPGIDEVWIATSTERADDVVEEWCHDQGVLCFRGSESNVLSRFVGCAEASEADIILRATCDSPFMDPQVIGAVVRLRKQTDAAYCSNVSPRTFSDGLDVECFTREALMAAHAEATRPIDLDCVTTWIERNRSRFPAETVINPIPGLQDERWVLDTADDYKFCQAIASHWPWTKGPPSQLDILGILDEHPELRELNKHHPMNERYFQSLAEEPIYARSYQRSQAQFEKAKAIIPLAAQTFSKSYLQYPQPSPLFLSHGQGGLVWDNDGNEYVDLVSALLPNILGYRDVEIDTAVRRQLNSGISFSLATELEAELAETLCRLIPCAEAVRFGKTGTDVTTAAVRVARAYTGRDRVIICGGFHGWSSWSTERNVGVTAGEQQDTIRIPFGSRHMPVWSNDVAAVIVEPESNPTYLQFLRDWCDKNGAILIFDEIITGARFDLGGAQKLFDVIPDLATFGKGIANGMPLSALVGWRHIMAKLAPPENVFFSGTFLGEALSLAASIATIKKMERDDVISKLWETGERLFDGATALVQRHGLTDVISFHGLAPLIRLRFRDDQIAALFRKEMIGSGTLIAASHNVCAAHGDGEVRRALRSYDHTLGIIRQAIEAGDVAQRLSGASVAPMVRAS